MSGEVSPPLAVADPGIGNGGLRLSDYRGAEDAEGFGVWEGVCPVPPSQKIFLTLDLKMSISNAF